MFPRRALPERVSFRKPKSSVNLLLLGSAMYTRVATATSMAPVSTWVSPEPTCREATPWDTIKATAAAALPMGANTPAMSPPRP